MAAVKTYYLRDKLLNWIKGTTFGTAPTPVYVALFTVAPTDAYTSGSPTGTEVSGGSYARVAIAWSGITDTTGVSSSMSNSAQIAFVQATGNWGTVVDAAIMDAPTGGNMLYFGVLTAPQTVNTGNQFVFNAAQLALSEA